MPRRLLAQARRRGGGPARAAAGHHGPADRGARLRRRPRPGQTPDDGGGRGPAGRRGYVHQRQPPLRGSAGHSRRYGRAEYSACRRTSGRMSSWSPTAPRPIGLAIGRARPRRRRASSPARVTSRGSTSAGEVLPFDDREVVARARSSAAEPPGAEARWREGGRSRDPTAAGAGSPRSPAAASTGMADPRDRWSAARSSSTPGPSSRGRCSSRCRASAPTGTTSRPRRVAAGAVAVLASTARVDGPAVIVGDAGGRTRAAGHRASAWTCRDDHRHRHHRLGGQDLDQGPARPGSPRGRARPSRPPARSTTRSAIPLTVLRADEGTRYLVLEMGARGHRAHRHLSRDRAARRSASCSTSAAPTSASSAARRRSPGPRASWSRRCPRTAPPSSTPTTRWCAAMAARTPAGIVTFGRSPERDRTGRGREPLDDAGPRRVHAASPRRGRAGAAAAARRARGARTRWPPPRPRGALGLPVADIAEALSEAEPGQPLADGGHRAPGRGHRGQRRLQRQSRVDARRLRRCSSHMAGGRRALRGPRRDGRAGCVDGRGTDEDRAVLPRAAVSPACRRRPRPTRRRCLTGPGRWGHGRENACRCEDVGAARGRARRERLRPRDVVLVKGSRVAGLERVRQGPRAAGLERWPHDAEDHHSSRVRRWH